MTDRFGISSQTIPELRTDCRYLGFVSGELPVTFAHRAGQGPGDENSALWERDWQCTFALCQGMNGHCSVQDTPNSGCCCSGHVQHLPLSIVHSWREQILSGETWGVRGVSLVLRWVLLWEGIVSAGTQLGGSMSLWLLPHRRKNCLMLSWKEWFCCCLEGNQKTARSKGNVSSHSVHWTGEMFQWRFFSFL